MSRRLLTTLIGFGFLAGVALASAWPLPLLYVGAAAAVCFSLSLVTRSLPRRALLVGALAAGGICFGLVRWQYAVRLAPDDISRAVGRTAEVVGTVVREPELRGESIRVTVGVSALAGKPASGRMLLTVPVGSSYRFGETVQPRCLLEEPWAGTGSFDYRRWLRRYGVTAVCSRPQLLSAQPAADRSVAGALYSFKAKLTEVAGRTVPEPQASLLAGLLWGGRQTLPAELVEAFRRAGLSHIVAVSGYNTSLVAGCLEALLVGIGLARRRALPLTLLALASFVVLCGAGAAVLRAGLMASAVLVARSLGRPAAANRALLLVAVGMVAANPYLLVADVGFQLSVAATWGMVNVGRPVQAALGWVPAKLGLREALGSTLAATATTLPISLGQFGMLSAVAPLANVLVVPAIPLTMAVGAIAVGLGLIWLPLGQLAGLVAWLPLQYVTEVGEQLGGLSVAAVTLPPLGRWAWLLYGPLVAWMWLRHCRGTT